VVFAAVGGSVARGAMRGASAGVRGARSLFARGALATEEAVVGGAEIALNKGAIKATESSAGILFKTERKAAYLPQLTYQGGRVSESIAHISNPLVNPEKLLRGTHGNAGNIPLEVAKMMEGKTFASFNEFRAEFWKSMAQSKYAKEFGEQNVIRMREGLAPFAPNTQRLGGQKTYQLHHKIPIHQGGATYDLSNLTVTTPKFHQEILSRLFHFGGK